LGRLERQKRQLIEQANKRILGEQDILDLSVVDGVDPPNKKKESNLSSNSDPKTIAKAIVDSTRNLSDKIGLAGGTREEELYEALKYVVPEKAYEIGVELDKLIPVNWENENVEWFDLLKGGILFDFILASDNRPFPKWGFSNTKLNSLGGGFDRFLKSELTKEEYRKAYKILEDNGFWRKDFGNKRQVGRKGIIFKDGARRTKSAKLYIWLPKNEDIPDFTEDVGLAYIVKKDDNLSMIAKKHNTTLEKLLELNKQVYPNIDLIHPGDTIRVPI